MSAYVGADYIQYYSRLVIISVPIILSKLLQPAEWPLLLWGNNWDGTDICTYFMASLLDVISTNICWHGICRCLTESTSWYHNLQAIWDSVAKDHATYEWILWTATCVIKLIWKLFTSTFFLSTKISSIWLWHFSNQVNQTSALDRSTTSYSFQVEESCLLYSITLGVIPENKSNSNCPKLLYSTPKILWPSGRHTIGKCLY